MIKKLPFHLFPLISLCLFGSCAEQLPSGFIGPKREIVIKPGMPLMMIADTLRQAGVINSAFYFRLLAWFYNYDNKIHPGRYRFAPNLSPHLVLKTLAREVPALLMVTIPEGYTQKQIARLLEENGICSKDSFLAACTDTTFLRSLNIPFATAEGYLFPETYEFQTGSHPKTVIRRLVQQFRLVIDELKRKYPTDLTEPQIVVLASIVEKEAKIPEEFPIIAGVFLNRLKRHWPLQSCATVKFILPEPKERLSFDDLKTPSPYNTYLHPGLPPGPICNPGRAALIGVFSPTRHNYLFFVAKGDGGHIFSSTPAEHEAAMRRVHSRIFHRR